MTLTDGTRYARTRLLVLAVAVLLPSACGAGDEPSAMAGAEETAQQVGGTVTAGVLPLGSAWVVLGSDTVVAEVARTPEEREKGLMYRSDLPQGTGMLFVFPDEERRSFWMANTYIPLDIAYIDAALRIVDIKQMEPEVTDLYRSAAPAMFALEVPQGWFAAHAVNVGDVVEVVFGPR